MKFSISKEGLVNQKELFNNDLSPVILVLKFWPASSPVINLAVVPELPKYNFLFGFFSDLKPLP